MNDTSTQKALLEAQMQALEESLSTVSRQNPINPNDWEPSATDEAEADPNLEANHMQRFAENVAIAEDLEARLADVRDALARIDAGTYGTCEVCGEEIEADRLQADPSARTCKTHLS